MFPTAAAFWNRGNDGAERSSRPAGLQGWPSRTPMTSGFHNTGGRKVAGVAWVIRVFIANDRRGKAKHKMGTSRAMIRWTAANSVRRCPVSSVVDTRSIDPSMSDPTGWRCPLVRIPDMCAAGTEPEIGVQGGIRIGCQQPEERGMVLAAEYSLHQRADLEADHIHSHAHAREAVANDRGPAFSEVLPFCVSNVNRTGAPLASSSRPS